MGGQLRGGEGGGGGVTQTGLCHSDGRSRRSDVVSGPGSMRGDRQRDSRTQPQQIVRSEEAEDAEESTSENI